MVRRMHSRGSRSASVDADGVHLPRGWDGVLEVAFDGRRIWSVRPDRYPVDARGLRHLGWPETVRQRLDGVADVAVRDHLSQDVLFAQTVAFGSGQGRVEFTNATGDLLEVNKWGYLAKSFSSQSRAAVDALLDGVEVVLAALRDDLALDAFLSYGMLLGAVREGKLIGHDGDADISYVSAYAHPSDVLREGFRVERHFRDLGWRVKRVNGGFLQLFVPTPSGAWINIDIYSCAFIEGCFYQVGEIRAAIPREKVLPPSEVVLEGRAFPAPADPGLLLELSYGAGWRVPDPSFEFATPRAVTRRLDGWWGGYAVQSGAWTHFRRGAGEKVVPRAPSPFARWVHEQETDRDDPARLVVDVGCGNGRDTVFFARQGLDAIGLDYTEIALRQSRRLARRRLRRSAGPGRAGFGRLDLGDLRATLTTGAQLARDRGPAVVYARFLLSSLDDASRRRLWRLASMTLRAGGRLYLEFRTPGDRYLPHHFPDRGRRFLDPALVRSEIEAAGGSVVHEETGRGLARFEDEDPQVCRMVGVWTACTG
jgi:SAM-dependent methyltransferase